MKKTTHFITLSVASALLSGVCAQAAETNKTKSVVSPPVSAKSETTDLFTAPLKANPLQAAPKQIDPEAVVLRVNGKEIKQKDLLQAMQATIQQLQARGISPQQLQQLQGTLIKNIENQIITQTLMEQAVKKENITVDAAKFEKIKTEIRENFKKSPQAKRGMSFEDALKQNGSTPEKFEADIKNQMMIKQFVDSLVKDVKDVSDETAKKYYDDNLDKFKQPELVTASHILILIDKTDDEAKKAEKKAKIEKIRRDIIAGTITFEDAAKANSDCPSKAQGGALGPFGKGRMDPAFEVAAFTQEKGEIGEVVKSQFGYHIIKVTDHKDEGVVPFNEAKKQIVGFLTGQEKQKVVNAYIKSLRDAAKIEHVSVK